MCQPSLRQIIWSMWKYNSRIPILCCPVLGHSPTRTETCALSCERAGEGVTLEQLRHCLSVLISARQDVDGSPDGSICVAVCRTEIGCRIAA